MLFKIKICKTLPNIYVLSYLHQKEVTCISIKIGFSIDELRYYRRKCHGLHHRTGLHYPIILVYTIL